MVATSLLEWVRGGLQDNSFPPHQVVVISIGKAFRDLRGGTRRGSPFNETPQYPGSSLSFSQKALYACWYGVEFYIWIGVPNCQKLKIQRSVCEPYDLKFEGRWIFFMSSEGVRTGEVCGFKLMLPCSWSGSNQIEISGKNTQIIQRNVQNFDKSLEDSSS